MGQKKQNPSLPPPPAGEPEGRKAWMGRSPVSCPRAVVATAPARRGWEACAGAGGGWTRPWLLPAGRSAPKLPASI